MMQADLVRHRRNLERLHQRAARGSRAPHRTRAGFGFEGEARGGHSIRRRRRQPAGNARGRSHRRSGAGDSACQEAKKSFYFRGPDDRHNLKAANFTTFALLAEGIDEEAWLFHLRRGDYSQWFRDAVEDRYLADQTERIEQRSGLEPTETRHLIRSLIDARYTLSE